MLYIFNQLSIQQNMISFKVTRNKIKKYASKMFKPLYFLKIF